MSKATKKKHVAKEALDEYYVPEGDEEIVKVVGGRGNNLHEVEAADGRKFLVSMPTKFRKSLWIKRGDFVIVTPIKEGNKVLAEIVYVLYSKQIKYLQQEGCWPEYFSERHNEEADFEKNLNGKSKIQKNEAADVNTENCSEDSSDDSDSDLLFENPNRPNIIYYEESESSDDDSGEECDTEEENENEHVDEEAEVCSDDTANALSNLTVSASGDPAKEITSSNGE